MNDNLGKEAEQKIWKSINYPPFCDSYEVSSLGDVRSVDRYVKSRGNGRRFRYGKLLTVFTFTNTNYKYVRLTHNGIGKNVLLHRIVACTFLPNPLNLPEVNHIDGNPANNAVSNLEWVTSRDNTLKAIQSGQIVCSDTNHMQYMTKCAIPKLSKQVQCIETGEVWKSIKEFLSAIHRSAYNIFQNNFATIDGYTYVKYGGDK